MIGLRGSGRRCEVLVWCGVALAVGGLAAGLGAARASGAPLRQLAPLSAPGRTAGMIGMRVAATRNVVVMAGPLTRRSVAFVYVRASDGSFPRSPTARLSVAYRGARFVGSVAISGSTIVVGDPYAHVGSEVAQGAAYVFVCPQGGWRNERQTATLTAGTAGSHFGTAVGVWGDTVVASSRQFAGDQSAGARAATYVFDRPAGGWQTTSPAAVLSLPSSSPDTAGASVAINATTIAVGNPSSGQVDIYSRPRGGWRSMVPTAVLTSPTRSSDLGSTIAMAGNTIAASVRIRGAIPAGDRSAIDVFTRTGPRWRNEHHAATLTARNETEGTDVGDSLAINKRTILAGAPFAKVRGVQSGSVYVFDRPAGGWANGLDTQRLTVQRPRFKALFGSGVALAGRNAIIGASGIHHQRGGAFVFGS
jgi:hypothetical protein